MMMSASSHIHSHTHIHIHTQGFVNAPPRFLSIQPWKGAIHPPEPEPENVVAAPDEDLVIDWVYGYR
jgi:hypothetical protein